MKKITKDDYIISSNLRYIFQKATLIASDLRLDRLNTSCVLLAMIADAYSCINGIYLLNGIKVDVSTFLNSMVTKKEFYEQIMGVNFPFVGYKIEDNTELFEGIKAEISTVANCNATNEIIDVKATEITNIILNIIEEYTIPNFEDMQYSVAYSSNLKNAITDAGSRCRSNGVDCINDENLLYSILNLPDCSAKRLLDLITQTLVNANVEYDIVDMVEDLVDNYTIYFESFEEKVVIPKSLENCCTILNDNYEKGVKCDILGRDEELAELWHILSKKQKSNAILAGEAGVGKSAIIEALTMSIVNETCPKKFIGYNVVELNVSGMVAGTKYRGEFEKKVEYLIDFVNHYDNLIIFIDEMHHLMGAGSSEGSGPDLSGSLKPILARDKVKFIGATTLAEYKKYICRDNAFKRRLELVIVKEPKPSEVLPMLKVKIENLKKFHDVTIDEEILRYVQLCASCFNTTTCNPDKTLDLIDRAMAVASVNCKKVTVEHVDKVFYKNYKEYKNNSDESNKRTAYHESGHFVTNFLYKDVLVDEEVYALSVIPGFGFLGANIIESTGIQPKGDDKYYKAEIASLLAGRIAEEIFFNEKTSGATNDLGRASRIARNMVSNYGLSSDEYMNFSLYDGGSGNTLPFSEKVIDGINKEAKEIVDKVYEHTKNMLSLETNKSKIEAVAKVLLEKKIVSAKELEEKLEKM